MIKTIVELDLKGYSDVAREVEEQFSADFVMRLNEQIQGFVAEALRVAGVAPADAVMAKTGDGTILMFDTPSTAHVFAEAVHNATRVHNHGKTVPAAKRWFRIGIATGELAIKEVDGSKQMAGSVIARAVRLEAAGNVGEILADPDTYDGLTNEQRACYAPQEQVRGKREEVFAARRYIVIADLAASPVADKAADRPKATTTPNNLPRLHSFFGRDKELKTIADALSPKTRTWGALIDGPGGMGKTSLAVRAAESAPPGQFGRILFLSSKQRRMTPDGERKLSDFVVPGYLDMLNETARLLGRPELAKEPEDARARVVIDALEPARALLILDNLESLGKDQQNRLFEFLSQLPPGCKAIATSRRRTDVDARIIRLGKLEQDAALALLKELAVDRPLLDKATDADRIHLYEESGGNPLLLRWIAGQLGRGRCRTLASALELCRNASGENDPLEFIFGDLLETFTEAETKALAALSYFTQQVEVKHVAELAGLSKTAAHTALGDLANRALVVPDEEDCHFALVPMVGDFLRRRKPEVVAETGDRLEKRAYALAVQNGYQKHDRFPVLDAAWPTVAAALPRFLAGPNGRFQTVCVALERFLEFTGRWDEWLALLRDAEAKAVAADDSSNAGWRAYYAGRVHSLRGQSAEVLACADRAEAHWRQAGARERAAAIHLRGIGHQLAKAYATAIAAYREAVELWRTLKPESADVAIGLNALAGAEQLSGDLDAAERDYREALRIAKAVDFREGIAAYTGNLATLALERGDWLGAEALVREALSLSEKLGRREMIAEDHRRIAKALARQGRKAEALPHARLAVEIHTALRSPHLESARQTLAECEG